MQLGMCCCNNRVPVPDCFNCTDKRGIDTRYMALELSGFGWDLTTGSWCSGTVDYYDYDLSVTPNVITYMGTANFDLQMKVPSLSALNTTINLEWKPDWYNTSPFYAGGLMAPTPASVNGGCHWLWNHANAVHATGYPNHWSVDPATNAVDVEYSQVLDQYEYEPLTPAYYDSSSMWGREYDYTDTRCGTLAPTGLRNWVCSNHVYGFTVRMGFITNPTAFPAGKYWWVSIVGFPLLFTNFYASGTAPNGSRPAIVSAGAFGNGMGVCPPPPLSGLVPDPINGSGQPEFCYRLPSGLPGRMDLEYIKIIDCENDFRGDPLTLELYKEGASNVLAGVTQPSTITLIPVTP